MFLASAYRTLALSFVVRMTERERDALDTIRFRFESDSNAQSVLIIPNEITRVKETPKQENANKKLHITLWELRYDDGC